MADNRHFGTNVPKDVNTRVSAVWFGQDGREEKVWSMVRSREWWVFCGFLNEGAINLAFPVGVAAMLIGGVGATVPPEDWQCLNIDLPEGVGAAEVPLEDPEPGKVADFGSRGRAVWEQDKFIVACVRKEAIAKEAVLGILHHHMEEIGPHSADSDIIPLTRGYWTSIVNILEGLRQAAERSGGERR